MKIEFFIYFALACLSVGIWAAVIFVIRRRTTHLKTTPLTKDSNFQDYGDRDDISSRLVEVEQAINKLRVDFATMNIELASLKAKTVISLPEESWSRDKSLDQISVIPTIGESIDKDTWVRKDNVAQLPTARDLLALAFSQQGSKSSTEENSASS